MDMKLDKRFAEALVFSFELHSGQLRKGTDIPYIAHLLSVASIVLEHGGSEDESIAALLHDAIEDQGGKDVKEEIERRFGKTVVQIVEGCTDTDRVPKPPWKQRKEDYINHIAHASNSVRLVSAADKLHNSRSILHDFKLVGGRIWDRFKGGKEGTLWYYRSLVNEYKKKGNNPIIEELENIVNELERITMDGSGE